MQGNFIQNGSTEKKCCRKCGTWKPLMCFETRVYVGKRGTTKRPHNWCRECKALNTREWVKKVGKKRARNGGLLRRYGITHVTYAEMFAAQGGACAVCGDTVMPTDPRTGEPYDLAVDHDHVTGKVRSLLCPGCNNGLGCFRDDPVRLQQAIDYLRKHAT